RRHPTVEQTQRPRTSPAAAFTTEISPMPSDQLRALYHQSQLHRAPPDDICGQLTSSTADRQPLRLSQAERALLRRMPRPADPFPAFNGGGSCLVIDPNSD